MRLIIKGSSNKIITLSKELRLRVKRNDLEMVIQKTKTEESEEESTQVGLAEAIEKVKAIKKSIAKDAKAAEAKEFKKARAEEIAEAKAKGEIRKRQDLNTKIAEEAKAAKKAKEAEEAEETERAIEYAKNKMNEEAGIATPKKRGRKKKV